MTEPNIASEHASPYGGESAPPQYLTIGEVEAEDGCYFHDGDEWTAMFGYATTDITNDSVLGEPAQALMAFIRSGSNFWARPNKVLMTTERRWSGYSEYTITSTWTEVILTAPDWNMAHRWESLPAFFKALGEASDDRRY